MTEVLRIEFHPAAQPKCCRIGWWFACYPPCDQHQLTLLLDTGITHLLTRWEERPEGADRTMMTLNSITMRRLHFSIPFGPAALVTAPEGDCTLRVLGAMEFQRDGVPGHAYDLLITFPEPKGGSSA